MIRKIFLNAILVNRRFYITLIINKIVNKFTKRLKITPKINQATSFVEPEDILEKQNSQLQSTLSQSPYLKLAFERNKELLQIDTSSEVQSDHQEIQKIKKKFILGIGSQRAGSTLLGIILSQHPFVELHPLKELHYFDTLFGLREQSVLKDFCLKMLNREFKQLIDSQNIKFISSTWRWYLETNWKLFLEPIEQINYLELYNNQLFRKNVLYTGELTPEYMLLNEEQIKAIKDIIDDAYVILICRNPVKRLLSAFNLLVEYEAVSVSNEELNTLLNSMIETNDPWIKTQVAYNNYSQTIKNYTKYFKNFLYLSYDDINSQPELILESLTNFLCINFNQESYLDCFATRINSFQTHYRPTTEILQKLDSLFEKQNEEIVSLFGKALVM